MDDPSLVELLAACDRAFATSAFDSWAQRADARAALAQLRAGLERPYSLAVVGEFSSGKSYLLNALLGAVQLDAGGIRGLLAVDINPSTATITELSYAAEPSAIARYPSGRTERIPIDRLARFVAVGHDEPGAMHDATADDDSAPTSVEVGVRSPFLRRGFVVADTPGLASLNPAHRRATLGFLPRADAVLYLIDTQQPFSDGDAAFLTLVGAHVRTVFIVQTKIDLWRMIEANGKPAWENARERIAGNAARFAPGAEIAAVSAREYALGVLEHKPELRERSGFPALLASLDRSLAERVRAGRLATVRERLAGWLDEARRSLACERELLALDDAQLHAERAAAGTRLEERDRRLARERDAIERAAGERRAWIEARGDDLGTTLVRALAATLDVADIDRIRDRNRLHVLVDATANPVLDRFGAQLAADTARALERAAHDHPAIRLVELAAARLGGADGSGAWSRDLAAGIRSTIVLDAIGGPTTAFVHAIAGAFAAGQHGTYMKRELGADLRERFFPQLTTDLTRFVAVTAQRVTDIYHDLAAAIERERARAREELIAPIDRALACAAENRDQAKRDLADALDQLAEFAAAAAALAPDDKLAAVVAAASLAAAEPEVPFDPQIYDRGLRPQRYRVVVLGALRRGKTSLINALAGLRVLQDDGSVETRFPIHVRYGPAAHAFGLDDAGAWFEIPADDAMAQAARTPVLIEVPWSYPHELVVVHAPAFDSGHPRAEEIALAAAQNASEIVALFSRQLSDRELAIYGRVGEFGKPMLFAHSIADHENPSERRQVVELADRYLRERGIATARIFTISALDYFEAAVAGRTPSSWNELGALRETLSAHAEAHMQRLTERELRRREPQPAARLAPAPASARVNLRRALDRFFGRVES
ncbi:MAG: dynamin family protein [Vulcanimicrobiaceae bacterium]